MNSDKVDNPSQTSPVGAHGNPTQTPGSGKQGKAQKNNTRMRSIVWLTVVTLLIALIWFLLWFFHFRFQEYTDDAYTNGNMVNVTSVVSGMPIAFFADNTDLVMKGQLLVQLDKTPFEITFHKELETLHSTILQVNQLYDNMLANKANIERLQTTVNKARFDYENRKGLVNESAVSVEDYTHTKDDLSIAEASFAQANAQLKASIDALGQTPLHQHPLIETQKNVLRTAYYNLYHSDIFAPITGFVAQRSVQPGQGVKTDTFMMAIIPTEGMWIDANFKETQLKNMRIGQPASVTVDLYGSSVEFNGLVGGIASGTGSVFSLIPPQNATGNWIKIVQRLPVRIYLDKEQMEKFPLRLGLSTQVYVDITNTDLPSLAKKPTEQPILTTDVFQLNLDKLNQMLDKTVNDNITKFYRAKNR